MELSKSEVLVLIDEYRKQRVLWDPLHKGYFNTEIKGRAWQAIATACAVDEKDARRKMASLLGSFRREKAKGKKVVQNGSLSDYKSTWFAFQKFKFLLEETSDQISVSAPSEGESEHYDEDCDYDEIQIIVPKTEMSPDGYETHENDPTEYANPPAFIEPTPPSKRPRLSSTLSENTSQEPRPLRVKKESELKAHVITKDQEMRNTTSKFVDYLEAKLNQYDATTNAILIHKISQLIFEADMNSSKSNASYSYMSTSPRSCLTPSPLFNSNNPNIEEQKTECE